MRLGRQWVVVSLEFEVGEGVKELGVGMHYKLEKTLCTVA